MSYESVSNIGDLGEVQIGYPLTFRSRDCRGRTANPENGWFYDRDRSAACECGGISRIDDLLVWDDSPSNFYGAQQGVVFADAPYCAFLSPNFDTPEPQRVLDRKRSTFSERAALDGNCESFVISIVRVASDNRLDHTPCGQLFVAHDRRLNSDSVFLGLEIHEISYRGAFSWAISKQGHPSRQSKSGD